MKKSKDTIALKDAIAIGIGGMVGGGIFAVLGLAVSLAKGGTPLAFLMAGIIALFTAYSYSKLSLSYPDRGGTVKFINEGFGRGVFSGGINNLLWIIVAPTAIAAYVSDQYRVRAIGRIDSIAEQLFAITTERRLSHPAIVAIIQVARRKVFGADPRARRRAADGSQDQVAPPVRPPGSRGRARSPGKVS